MELGSSSELASKTACMAQVVSGKLRGVAVVVAGCLGLRPLPYRIQIGRDLVRGLGGGRHESGVAWVEEVVVVGVVVGSGVTIRVAATGVVVLVEVMVVVIVGEEVVGVMVVVVEVIGVVEVEVIGEVVGVAVFTRLRQRPYRIHMGGCLEVLRGISGGRVGGEVGVEGVVIEVVESGVVWGVVVVEVGVAHGVRGGVVVVVFGVEVVVEGVGGSVLEGLAWCSSQ